MLLFVLTARAFLQKLLVIGILQPYLRQQQGSAYILMPKFNFGQPAVKREMQILEMAGSFKQRSLRFNRATRAVKDWRRSPQVGSLTF